MAASPGQTEQPREVVDATAAVRSLADPRAPSYNGLLELVIIIIITIIIFVLLLVY